MAVHDADTVERVARAMHRDKSPQRDWAHINDEARASWRAAARTVISAHMCGQAPILAAKRLAVWADVDARRPYKRYEEHPEAMRRYWERAAEVGMAELWRSGTPSV